MAAVSARELPDESILPQAVLDQVRSLLRGLKFGSVELTVHDGRIVQVERKERIRFTNQD